MPYIGGTALANQFISKYALSGHLLDLYSDEWALNNEDLEGISVALFKEYDAQFGTAYRNHILLISCDWYEDSNSNFSTDLINIFPKYKRQLRDYSENIFFDPSFVLINLATQQISSVGLGRNNRFFMTDVETNISVSLNLPNDISARAVFGIEDNNYLPNFLKLDHAGIVYKFLTSLSAMGSLVYLRDSDCTPWLYDELSYANPNEDGQYEVDGESYSAQDRDELIKAHANYNSEIQIHERFLMKFFPTLDFSSLNDY